MRIVDPRKVVVVFALGLALCVPSLIVNAQRPKPTPKPPANPAQRDATKPPGSEQNQSAPPEAHPNTQDPTAPPGAQTAPANPGATPTPEPPSQEPQFPKVEPRPLPALPDLTRLGVNSGNVVTLSLNEAVRRALQNNNDIEVAKDDVRFAESQLRSFLGVYDAVFSVTPQYDKRITPQSSTLGGGGSSGTVSNSTFTLSPTVSKGFAEGGGFYTFTFANSRTTTSSSFASLPTAYSSNLSFQLTQPLWRNRTIDNNRHTIRVQKKRVQQSDADFRRKTIDVISQVQSAYWDLVFAMRDQQIQLDNLNLSRENLRQIEAQIAAGAKAPLDRAEVLTEIANRQSALLTATQTVSIAENALKQLILKNTGSPDWSAQLTPTDTPAVDTTPVNLNDAIAEARKNRPELQRLQLQRDINDIDLEYYRNQTKPQIDFQATLATTGLAGTPGIPTVPVGTNVPIISGDPNFSASAFLLQQIQNIRTQSLGLPPVTVPTVATTSSTPANLVGGYGKDLANLFGFGTRTAIVGVAISFPFKNTVAKENLAGALIQKEQLDASVRSTEQIVEVDVRNAAQAVESSRQRVLTARSARANAEVQLEGEQRLYSVGRSTTFLLFQRQNALANARDAELRAETDYNKAVSNLQHATSSTLHANNVVVELPVRP